MGGDVTGDLDLRTVLLLLVAVGALGAAWYVARSSPRLVVAGWAAVCFLAPIWVGVQAGVYWSALTAVTIVALAAWSTATFTFSYVDVLVVGFVLLVLAAFLVGGSTWGHVLIVLFGWLVPYVWGRFVLARVEADGCTPASPSRRPPRPCSGSSSSRPASIRSSGSHAGNGAWRTWHELQPGRDSSGPRAHSATRSPSRARWR